MALTPNVMMAAEALLAEDALQRGGGTDSDLSYTNQVIVADYVDTAYDYMVAAHGKVVAGAFVNGTEYQVIKQGTTNNWQKAGATSGFVGEIFTAIDNGGAPGIDPGEASPTTPLAGTIIPPSLAQDFIHRLDNTTPYISNSVPPSAGFEAPMSSVVNQHAENLFPKLPPIDAIDTRNQQYVLYAMIAMGQKEQANQYVNSAVNGVCSATFTSQDALMTGNISAISTDVQGWGDELIDSGLLFDFAKLDNLGTPQAIIEALMRTNMLGLISDELTIKGIDVTPLVRAIRDNPDQVLSPIVQKRCYEAFELVTGKKLVDILKAMHFETTGLTTMQDLLDLTKVFPSTYATLTAPNNGNLQKIFTPAGTVQTWVANLSSPIIAVIPDEQAKPNWAFVISLGQIRGILNSTPDSIGNAAISVEDNDGLTNTGSLTEPLPSSTTSFFVDNMGGGTGPDTTFYLSDLVGAPAGLYGSANTSVVNNHFEHIQAAGGFDDIAEVLLVMRDVLNHTNISTGVSHTDDGGPGPYHITIDPGYPAEGTYSSGADYPYTTALTALLLELDDAVDSYMASYPNEHNEMLAGATTTIDSTIAGIKQLWDADVRFFLTYVPGYQTSEPEDGIEPGASVPDWINGLPANKKSTLAFAENLPFYGKKTTKGDIVEILEAMVKDNLGGDAIVAAMREGRNRDKLANANIGYDGEIDDQSATPEPGNIS